MKRLWNNPVFLFVLGFGLILLALFAISLYRMKPDSVHLTIINNEPFTMRSITISVTGKDYKAKDISAGNRITLPIRARGESGIAIEYENGVSQRIKVSAGCYLEPNHIGTITVSIRDGKTLHVDNKSYPDFSFWTVVRRVVFGDKAYFESVRND